MGRPRFAFFSTLACCLTLAQAALAGINFVGTELITVEPRPEFMVAGDLNNDHHTDIVVVAPQSNGVDVYLADTSQDSKFAPARTMHFGAKLGSPALGDLNGDGNLDLAVTDISANSVWILLGKGDGTFLTPYQIAVPNSKNPSSVTIGNFDTTGNNDLAVADSRLGRVFILRNDNKTPPGFLQGGQIDVGLDPEDIRAVDLNNDGHVDLLVLNLGGPRVKELDTILWTAVTQGFPVFDAPQKFTIGANPSSMVVADFNNDNLPDVAMLNRPAGGTGNSEIDVLLNANNGVFNPARIIPVPCPFFTGGAPCKSLELAAGDFDGNGFIDLMVALSDPRRTNGSASSLADAMQAFEGRGDGDFVYGGVLATQKSPLSMVSADVTGDGNLDIVIANQRTLNLQAFVNTSTGPGTPNGATCLLDDECLSNRCTNGVCCADQCDLLTNEQCNVPGREGTCVPVPPAAMTCTLATECGSKCVNGSSAGASCTSNAGCPGGKCQANPCVDGFCCDQACDGGRCDRDGFQGVCVPGIPDGQPCSGDNAECSSGFCSPGGDIPDGFVCCHSACTGGFCDDSGVCNALTSNGAPCQNSSACQSGICDAFDGICCETECNPATQACAPDQGVCQPLPTPGPTSTATPRATPVATGACSVSGDCDSLNCDNGACCQSSTPCPGGEQCQLDTGLCAISAPTPTATPHTESPTPIATGPTPDPCGTCPGGTHCLNGLCVSTSSGGGCSTVGDAPAPGNLAVTALLPLALWVGRRWQLRSVRVRSRAPRQ